MAAMEPQVVGCGAPESSGSGEPETCPANRPAFDHVVGIMAATELQWPDVQRSTPAFRALWALAFAERRLDANAIYSWGQPTSRISRFWSHSWHCSKLAKIGMLLLVHNGMAAICMGTATAVLLSVVLWAVNGPMSTQHQITAATLQEQYHVAIVSQQLAGVTCNLLGLLVSALVLLFWRNKTRVFLDRICVHQTNPQLKVAGLCSITAILHSSDELLICWDPTYSQRLWCLSLVHPSVSFHFVSSIKANLREDYVAALS